MEAKVNDDTSLGINLKWLIQIIVLAGAAVWGYFGLTSKISQLEIDVLRMSYGLDCNKHSASEIAKKLGINGSSSYVRVSQLKKQAVDKLIENVDHSQVLDYL